MAWGKCFLTTSFLILKHISHFISLFAFLKKHLALNNCHSFPSISRIVPKRVNTVTTTTTTTISTITTTASMSSSDNKDHTTSTKYSNSRDVPTPSLACHDPSNPLIPGSPKTTLSSTLETGASLSQDFAPLQSVCGHLNAFHVYASDPTRFVEANHYCAHLTEDVRQCILYDSPNPGARILGIEYMITPKLYETLPQEERRYWHTHVFEVKSGMLIMPKPTGLMPQAAWEKAEKTEMEQVITLYGKIYHLWQVDRGDKLPLGEPQLMTSFTEESQFPDMEKVLDERDKRFPGADWRAKRESRKDIEVPELHPDADWTWKKDKQQQ